MIMMMMMVGAIKLMSVANKKTFSYLLADLHNALMWHFLPE